MKQDLVSRQFRIILLVLMTLVVLSAFAAYKARPWHIRPVESYPCRLTSEGVTIAIDVLYQDPLAASIFDKNDMVTRGIMPVGIIIFNENNFPVSVEGGTIEVLWENERIHSLQPAEVVQRLFKKSGRNIFAPPQSGPQLPKVDLPALEDFERKFIQSKSIPAHDKGGGFIYLNVRDPKNIRDYFTNARMYIPDVTREDTGSKMIYFEVELKPIFEASKDK